MLLYLYTFDYDDGSTSCIAEAVSCLGEPAAKEHGEAETGSTRTSPSTRKVDAAESETAEASSGSPGQIGTPAIVGVSEGNAVAGESGLLNNVLVYAIADKYDIFELRELAKTKFLAEADSLMSTDEFPEIIKMVYKLPNSDRGLRDAVLNTCMKQLRILIDNETFTDTVRNIGDFGFEILSEALKQSDKQLKQISVQKAALEAKVKIAGAAKLKAELDMKQAEGALLNVITVVNRHEACSNCGAEFCGLLDADNPTRLRCAKGRVRHRVL